jgi:hypothetical protein
LLPAGLAAPAYDIIMVVDVGEAGTSFVVVGLLLMTSSHWPD